MESTLFMALGFSAFLLGLSLVWYVSSRKEGQQSQQSSEAILRAEEIAEKKIRDAEERAQTILDGAESLRDRIEQEFRDALGSFFDAETRNISAVIKELSRTYEERAKEIEGAYATLIDDVSKQVSASAERAVSEFKGFVKTEMSRYERLTDQGLEEWRRALEAEIEKKKKLAVRRIEESMYRILFFVSKEVLGKAIDSEEHQSLIIRALDDAKREGFFDF